MSLIKDKRGEVKPLLANAIHTLRNSGGFDAVLAFDVFAMRTLMVGAPPWEMTLHNDWNARPWQPHDDILAADWLQRNEVGVGVDTASQAVEVVARDREVHPVADYLESLDWDRTSRIDGAMTNYFGVDASPYAAAIGRVLFISAIARIMQPGCKADQIVILEGPQDIGKSTAIRTLFEPWFTDEISDLGSKDAALQCAGVWCIEIAELSSMNRSEVERVKAFLTRTVDRFRPPYGRRVIEAPRQCIFAGSTNQDEYLKDETGNRRFLPARTMRIDVEALARDRDQLWAEAVSLHQAGSGWWISTPSLRDMAGDEQRQRLVTDPWEANVRDFVEACVDDVSISQILAALEVKLERRTQADANRVARILKGLGFVRFRARIGERLEWRYRYKYGVKP